MTKLDELNEKIAVKNIEAALVENIQIAPAFAEQMAEMLVEYYQVKESNYEPLSVRGGAAVYKWRATGSIEDDELEDALTALDFSVKFLKATGKEFYLAWSTLVQERDRAQSAWIARNK